ncbi:MAG: GNAT family N-acetyltransferase [Dehalococcoidia bacterium]|jgi:predicted acetyltransferase
MRVTVTPASLEEKPVLWRLLQLYHYDFTEFIDDLKLEPNGEYAYRYLDNYWAPEPGEQRHPFLIRAGGELAGFALVRFVNNHYVMAEFFVMRPYRRHNVGATAAKDLFRTFPGDWIVHEVPKNRPAQAFWRRVIDEFTTGDFTEKVEDDGAYTQRFTSH